MKVIKFVDFVNENLHDTPEEYIKIALNKLKKKIESYFEDSSPESGDEKFITMSDALKKGKDQEKKKSEISFLELGLNLESSELSKYSALNDSIKFIMSDEDSRYDLTIIIPLDEVNLTDKTKDFTDKDIKKCFIKFKKYDMKNNIELVGQINKNVSISSIDENLLIELKIQLDDEYGGDDEKLEIETE
jgi:hypothetical protein